METSGVSELNLDDAVKELLVTYQELNGSVVKELHEHPTPLEFMRYVNKGRPFVVRGGVSDWPATQWTIEHLKKMMGETAIQVAVTPSGLVPRLKNDSQEFRSEGIGVLICPATLMQYGNLLMMARHIL